MKNVYLDYNIILEIKKNNKFKKDILKYKKYFRFFYSPAHVEEIFKAKKSEYRNEISQLLELLNELTDTWELLPPPGILLGGFTVEREKIGIIEIQEKAEECYKRIREWDTRDVIKDLSKMYLEQRNLSKIEEISNISFEELFENEKVHKQLREFSNKKSVSIDKYKKKYNEIKLDYDILEKVIELFFHFFNEIGYFTNRDKVEALSGIHDNTHCCYATKCDLLITTDNRFSRKCEAIYNFLDVKTKVKHIHYKEIRNISRILEEEK
jgi:hypothetical protein